MVSYHRDLDIHGPRVAGRSSSGARSAAAAVPTTAPAHLGLVTRCWRQELTLSPTQLALSEVRQRLASHCAWTGTAVGMAARKTVEQFLRHFERALSLW